jgi:N,N'-diacetyllegionaminate synthase
MRAVSIAGRPIAMGQVPYVIAEAGVNHNGDPALALRLVDAAASGGADAVKFQTFDPDVLALAGAETAGYQRRQTGAASQLDMLRALALPRDALEAAARRADALGIAFLSTPFDVASVRLLAELGVPAYKVGSGDLTNPILLRAVAADGRPVLLSTGMGTLAEVDAAVELLRSAGDPPLVVLQCTTAYPAAIEDANLRTIGVLAERYATPVGLSDHTLGITAAVAATALGAAVIEKHLTLDRSLPGPDHAASLEPDELRGLVDAVRDAHAALGDGEKRPAASEEEMRRVARRSLVVRHALRAGVRLAAGDLDARRPGSGIPAMRFDDVVGRVLRRDVAADALLDPADLDPPLTEPYG